MQRVVWFGIGSLVAGAAALGAMKLASPGAPVVPVVARVVVARVVVAPVVVAPVVVTPAPPPVAKPDLAAMLKMLGARVQAEQAAAYPAVEAGAGYQASDPGEQAPGKLFAVGDCERPSETERAAITKRIRATVNRYAWISFGCDERNGIVVDATYDIGHIGYWKILRVTDKKITTLSSLSGESSQDWMEWADEQTVSTWALVDVDGDGLLDVVSLHTQHEGGSSTTDIDVELRRSSDNKVVKLGGFERLRDYGFVRGSTSTLVLRASTSDDGEPDAAAQYRCIVASGFTDCPAATEAARIDHAAEIAGWFVHGHEYLPTGAAVPDRDQLAELLDVVRIAGDERARLLAAADETPPSYRIKRSIDAKLAVRAARPETRPAELATALGDTACTKCAYTVATTTKALREDRLERTDRLVYNGKVLASVTVRGPATECSACGYTTPGQQFAMKAYRHGTHTVALVFRNASAEESDPFSLEKRASTLADGTLYVFVDGTQVETRAALDSSWFRFDGDAEATGLAVTENTFVHWPQMPAAALDLIDAEAARSEAQHRLEGFDVNRWGDAAYVADVTRDRALVGI
ncbi:hypothetical protein BH11MYX2_BH11MYX2_16490 [soil metagenome]